MTVLHMDCRAGMAMFPDNTFDSIVTDPPYELGFMGKSWDATGIAYDVAMWREALRVLKPGGHLLSFSGSRTYHRMTCAIEDAGFEIRDQIMWIYGSGFPKSLDVSKAIDARGGNAHLTIEIGAAIKAARERRKMSATQCDRIFCGGSSNWSWFEGRPKGQRAPTPETFAAIAREWPELLSLAEKVAQVERDVIGKSKWSNSAAHFVPGEDHSARVTLDITAPATDAARQWEGWGTALKPAHEPICVARKPLIGTVAANVLAHGCGAINIDGCRVPVLDADYARNCSGDRGHSGTRGTEDEGVTNLHTGGGSAAAGRWPANLIHDGMPDEWARYFYCAKASKSDRGEGNTHPTVKPHDLMRYLLRLVTPPGGTALDPFAGSGSTFKAASAEGFDFIGFELQAEYVAIANARGRLTV